MTKRDIYESEKKNPGVIYLYPEGMFYRAYEMSAFYLCKLVHPFKVSGHYVKSAGAFIVSVGFPQAMLEKWSTGHPVADFRGGVTLKLASEEIASEGQYVAWKREIETHLREPVREESAGTPWRSDGLPVYGLAYRLTVEMTACCAMMPRSYRYSLGEQIRMLSMRMVLDIDHASKTTDKIPFVQSAIDGAEEVKLCLRLLSDLKALPEKRYLYFTPMLTDITRHLQGWKRSLGSRMPAGVAPDLP